MAWNVLVDHDSLLLACGSANIHRVLSVGSDVLMTEQSDSVAATSQLSQPCDGWTDGGHPFATKSSFLDPFRVSVLTLGPSPGHAAVPGVKQSD